MHEGFWAFRQAVTRILCGNGRAGLPCWGKRLGFDFFRFVGRRGLLSVFFVMVFLLGNVYICGGLECFVVDCGGNWC